MRYDRKIWIAYIVFCGCMLSVMLWAITREYKYGGNPNEEAIEEVSIGISQDAVDFLMYIHDAGKDSITIGSARLLIDTLNIEHPHIVLAQMKLESGNFKSNLAKSNNNFFGMKHPLTRPTVSLGSKKGYATFNSWSYSILDYALWQRRYARGLTEEEYLDMLSYKYAEDKNYVKKVKNIADSLLIEK